jgi:hypothetical protein
MAGTCYVDIETSQDIHLQPRSHFKVFCLFTKYMDIKRQKGESFIKSVFLLFREFLHHSYVRRRGGGTSLHNIHALLKYAVFTFFST